MGLGLGIGLRIGLRVGLRIGLRIWNMRFGIKREIYIRYGFDMDSIWRKRGRNKEKIESIVNVRVSYLIFWVGRY